ncbi:prostate-associated microseminoprotein-like [Leucoraja erinacea]|uniref:prostate-associated microseminoprotein-like n=1 Tax=Leucoraja erinaceus TaxID=7782 RepID=UPI0024542ADD|nr:prostate-associated microseminoprotein-like [Leucoraja erinacea]
MKPPGGGSGTEAVRSFTRAKWSGSEIMKLLLCIALLLPGPQLSESACFFQPQATDGRDTCFDLNDGTYHQYGEGWFSSNCWECVCARGGYKCCERYFMPFGVPEECVITFDIHTCSFHVKMKNDRSVDCDIGGAIGK